MLYQFVKHDFPVLATQSLYYIILFINLGGTSVTCFWCGCVSDNWTSGEDPWVRHIRTSPNCRFVILQKGEDFINSVLEQHGGIEADTTPAENLEVSCAAHVISWYVFSVKIHQISKHLSAHA